ncbi:hypothetical protein MCOR03_004206 [Pyricularia oryzae]|uniref:Uncharacterized protein n=1 Tax=Pyricularia grisea TaxID=148305 RepID=A0ABQ8NY10_PYRGI|nr:hypothetical protein MCOR33_001125 [Pyricularia grisea]KAI6499725.1 hypothetical protein MCOR11_003258 [Pyricularia oryzae]KAI6542194.1 hypothetical protein MCOR10_000493 [Pyricularia oryzae]KAI6560711.1 hypothetical protein MCOR03_004206 [Pyricularia oryzae]
MGPSAPILSPTAVLLEYVTWNHSLESRTRLRTSAVPIKAVCSSLFADHEAAVGTAVSPSHDEADVALDLGADGPLAQPLVRPVVNGLAAPVYAALAVHLAASLLGRRCAGQRAAEVPALRPGGLGEGLVAGQGGFCGRGRSSYATLAEKG